MSSLFSLQAFSGLSYGRKLVGVCEVEEVDGSRVVTIRSSVQVMYLKATIFSRYLI